MKKIRLFILIAVCGILSACGGGGGTTTTPDSFTPETKTQVVGPGGGSITHTLANSAAFQIDIPTGALTSDTTFTFTTQKPTEGQRFNYLLQPAGLVLANGAVATITVTLPSGQTLPSTGGLVYDNALIPYTTLPDGRLQVSLSKFAGTTVSGAPKKAGKASSETLQNMISAIYSPKVSMASSPDSCDDVPFLETDGGLSAVDAVETELYGRCMVSAVQDLADDGRFTEAVHAAQSVAAYLQRTGSGNADPLISQAGSIACTAYGLALDQARSTKVTNMGILDNLIKPIFFWEATVQFLGVTCSGIPAGEYITVIGAKTGEAIVYYEQEKPNLTDTSSSNYAAAKVEAGESAQIKNEVLALNPLAAVRSTVNSEVSQRAQPGLLDAMLQAPWERCRNTANYDELVYLMTTMDSPDAVKTAAQYCGSVLDAQTKGSSGSLTDQLAQPLGGVSAGEKRTSGSIKADKTGTISISGPIQALKCPDNYFYAGGSESLTINLDGTTIQTLDSPPYLNNSLVIDIATALEAAHPGNTSKLTQATLTIERTGTPCNGFWGANPSPLLTLNLSLSKVKKIAFERNGDIYVINPDGSNETQLTSGTDADDRTPTWSPDRTRLAFTRYIYDATNGWVANIYVMNADGSGITALTSGTAYHSGSPKWSPDGSRIAFGRTVVGQGWGDVYVMNSDGSGITRLTNGAYQVLSNYGPSWSPDSSRIAFYRFDNVSTVITGWDICVMNADGSGQTQLTTSTSADYDPSWSPDGAKIAFSRYYMMKTHIFTMNADGTGQIELTSGSDTHPVWSPDSAKIAFVRDNTNIYIINGDGSGLTLLTSGLSPAW